MWCPFALQRLTATGFPTNQNWHGSSIFLVLAHTSIGHPLFRPPLHAIPLDQRASSADLQWTVGPDRTKLWSRPTCFVDHDPA